ncbi:MAG: tryptophan-rich sensory protein [Bacilli bacterium]
MKWFKRILLFVLVVFLYFLPSFLFKSDLEFYNSLEGPKLPSIVFPIVWSIIYVLMGIFVVCIFDKRKDYNKKILLELSFFLSSIMLLVLPFHTFSLLNKVYF